MNAVFYVFSGTGNTARVCERVMAEWRAAGNEATLCRIRADEPAVDPDGFDLIVVGYPVHAFNTPASVLGFLKKFPKRKGEKPAYLLRTSGEPLGLNDASGITPARILARRGFRVKGEFSFVMPYNIIFRHSDKMAARMWQAGEGKSSDAVRVMAAGEGKRPSVNPFKRAVSFVLRIEHAAMPLLGRTFRAKKKSCIGCGKCAKVCPQGNITMSDGKPKFGGSCVGCMGCAFTCPKDAVRISLLNAWRVNGAYTFSGEPASDQEVCRYCRRAYLRYFRRAEKSGQREIRHSD